MIYVTGDIHGHIDISKLKSKYLKGEVGDYVIITGDFGLLFNPKQSKQEKYWIDWLSNKPWTTLFLDGNHENFDLLEKLETVNKFGSDVGKVNDSIFHLRRGRIYTIEEKKFFVFGGASSIDKKYRKEGISWWPQELPSYLEYKFAYKNLENHNYTVDYILTHEANTDMFKHLVSHHSEVYDLPKFIQDIVDKTEFKHHYFGHHHKDKTVKKHSCCYYKIHAIK